MSIEERNYASLKRDLEEKAKTEPGKAATLLRNLEAKLYHDHESVLAMPKTTLIMHLRQRGWEDLATKAIKGDYDF